jgi:hypothetical protein
LAGTCVADRPRYGPIVSAAAGIWQPAHKCREPEVRTKIAASPIANFGFKAALDS